MRAQLDVTRLWSPIIRERCQLLVLGAGLRVAGPLIKFSALGEPIVRRCRDSVVGPSGRLQKALRHHIVVLVLLATALSAA